VEAFLEADPDGSYVAVGNNNGISKAGPNLWNLTVCNSNESF
jgi:hypothetical protein